LVKYYKPQPLLTIEILKIKKSKSKEVNYFGPSGFYKLISSIMFYIFSALRLG